MCVDHTAVISTCMMDIGCVEDVQRKKNLVPSFFAYYSAATSVASIKECRVTVEMLANVGYTPGRNTKPDHIVSTLMGGICTKLALVSAMLLRACGTAADAPLLRTRSRSGSQDASALDAVWPPAWLSGRRALLAC